ncbi:hypothetical protein [Lentzea jiangxiensis]|uniref:hypothetical protein n=1 Tax=Lentzea jiangxiensis TaxID=641025 RepID=UPI00115FE567|nr:hypothetical protein [Lentzea jiangxiensis]
MPPVAPGGLDERRVAVRTGLGRQEHAPDLLVLTEVLQAELDVIEKCPESPAVRAGPGLP